MLTKVNMSQSYGNTAKPRLKQELVISEQLRATLEWVLFTFLCQTIDLFGIVTNIINIVCFVRLGFKDLVNISFLGLAVSDLGCLTTLIWTNICLTPAFRESDLPFDALEFQYLTSAWPHATFTRVTAWITALITLERCLCITAPLKVKYLVTPRRVVVITTCVFGLLIASVAPIYVVNRLDMKFYPHRNKTLIGLAYTADRENVEKVSFIINNGLIPISAFLLVVICTVILVIRLHKHARWRTKTTNHERTSNISNRNQKVAQMVVMISILFIVCIVPVSVIFIAMSLEPNLSIDGAYSSILTILLGACIILESVNSSANIFIYYHMSSKFKSVFCQIFWRGEVRSHTETSLKLQ